MRMYNKPRTIRYMRQELMSPKTNTQKRQADATTKPNTPYATEIPKEEPLPDIAKLNNARIIHGTYVHYYAVWGNRSK